MRGTSEIVGMTGAEKADLFEEGATKMVEGRYEATLALASLARSHAYRDMGFESVSDLAAARSKLEVWEVSQMLWVGKALLDRPELDVAFRDGVLSWSKVKALVAHVTQENVAGWIKKARGMSSNALEHEIAKMRDPIVGERMLPLYVPEHALAWFQELLGQKQAEKGEKNLNGGEFFYRMLDLMQAEMEDPAKALPVMGPVLPVPHWPGRSRHVPIPVQRAALKRARFRCERCGNRLGLVFHHSVIPFAEGGPHTLANIQVWCGRCHDQAHEEERHARLSETPSCEVVEEVAEPAMDPPPPIPRGKTSERDEPVLDQPPPIPFERMREDAAPVLDPPGAPAPCDGATEAVLAGARNGPA